MEAAFCKAVRDDLGRVDDTFLDHIAEIIVLGIITEACLCTS